MRKPRHRCSRCHRRKIIGQWFVTASKENIKFCRSCTISLVSRIAADNATIVIKAARAHIA